MKKLFAFLAVLTFASTFAFATPYTDTWNSGTHTGSLGAYIYCVPTLLPEATQYLDFGKFFNDYNGPVSGYIGWHLTGPTEADYMITFSQQPIPQGTTTATLIGSWSIGTRPNVITPFHAPADYVGSSTDEWPIGCNSAVTIQFHPSNLDATGDLGQQTWLVNVSVEAKI